AGAPLAVIAGAVVLSAVGMSIAGIVWRSLIQQKIPDAQQGQVTAWTEFGQLALTPITYLLVGPGITVLGLEGLLLVCAAAILAAALLPLLATGIRQLTLISTTDEKPVRGTSP
ncbi:hypothetical protein ACFQ07_05285, partial [Actinomadura adrarensis]